MNNFKTSLSIVLFIYDGNNHKRSLDELDKYLLDNDLNHDQLKRLLYPLMYSNGVKISNDQIILKCYSENDLKEMILCLYLFHN